jgi:hypothetical protein
LIGLDNCTEANVHDRLLAITQAEPRLISASRESMSAHVFTLHAELEGMRLLPTIEKLLMGWQEQGYELVATESVYRNLDRAHLPYFTAERGTIPGRSGTLLMQGKPFLPALPELEHAA